MEIYDEKEKLYLETGTLGVGLGTGILQVGEGIHPRDPHAGQLHIKNNRIWKQEPVQQENILQVGPTKAGFLRA